MFMKRTALLPVFSILLPFPLLATDVRVSNSNTVKAQSLYDRRKYAKVAAGKKEKR